jgi:hypothetical protein
MKKLALTFYPLLVLIFFIIALQRPIEHSLILFVIFNVLYVVQLYFIYNYIHKNVESNSRTIFFIMSMLFPPFQLYVLWKTKK